MSNHVQLFKQRYEVLAGHVHLATASDVGDVVMSIVTDVHPQRIAMAGLPEDLHTLLCQRCSEAKIAIAQPPFARDQLPAAVDVAEIGITAASFGIVETGTLVEIATDDAVRLVSTLPRIHIGLLWERDLLENLGDAASLMRTALQQNPRNCTITFISGPSRTADIEMRLTLGVHGPEVAHAVVVQETS